MQFGGTVFACRPSGWFTRSTCRRPGRSRRRVRSEQRWPGCVARECSGLPDVSVIRPCSLTGDLVKRSRADHRMVYFRLSSVASTGRYRRKSAIAEGAAGEGSPVPTSRPRVRAEGERASCRRAPAGPPLPAGAPGKWCGDSLGRVGAASGTSGGNTQFAHCC